MHFRKATREDLPTIIQMLANDKLGRSREIIQTPLPERYYHAFDNIDRDENQFLLVAEDGKDGIVGTLQLTFIQGLTYQGGLRAQIEAVRVREDQRGKKIGESMILWTIEKAKEKGAHMVQLTSDKQRPDAIRFYERLGFKASHEGMKLRLDI
jgi:GNAT superfamily N-acetyltransferase